ncbi:hypothetical protein Poly59_37170 [Rubripirellula reticaptiva]|uniref:Uncharacterized protein n=1 Tax=Rubripirellula reticaptiva TaxID=2528013 RepID=A0A5C6EKX0_9BACT|nr:hypothetical protein Poly59_37170 [Rubripirellula reticaptiva]
MARERGRQSGTPGSACRVALNVSLGETICVNGRVGVNGERGRVLAIPVGDRLGKGTFPNARVRQSETSSLTSAGKKVP